MLIVIAMSMKLEIIVIADVASRVDLVPRILGF